MIVDFRHQQLEINLKKKYFKVLTKKLIFFYFEQKVKELNMMN